jgi:hypothetical protein
MEKLASWVVFYSRSRAHGGRGVGRRSHVGDERGWTGKWCH